MVNNPNMNRLRPALLFVLFNLVFYCTGLAQDRQDTDIGQPGEKQEEQGQLLKSGQRRSIRERYLEQLRQSNLSAPALEEPLLAYPIDPTTYIIGPGDLLQLNLWGEVDSAYPLTVFPEGSVSIPSIGVVQVADETLSAAQEKIRAELEKKYRYVDFTLNLLQLRRFRVSVTGEVKRPATYFAQAQDRVSDMVELAGGTTTWADLKRIEIRHVDGSTEFADLQSFYSGGLFDKNPTLHGGDLIHVLSINPSTPLVTVESDQEVSGLYPIEVGEHLLSFLQNNKVLGREADLQNIKVFRNGEVLTQNYFDGQDGKTDIELQNGDHISISMLQEKIYVEGEVLRPGLYDFSPNFLAVNYAGMAGLTNSSGNIDNIQVVHAATGKVEKGRSVVVERGDRVIVPRSHREAVKDYFQIVGTVASVLVSFVLIKNVTGK